MLRRQNRGWSTRMLAVVAIHAAFAAVAYGQSFTCPQVVLSETHSCVVGKCSGQYSVNNCDTSNQTSSFQCVYQIPTCCGQSQKAFDSATEGGDCPGCSSLLRRPSLPSGPAATAKQGSTRQESTQGAPRTTNQTKSAKSPAPKNGGIPSREAEL